MKWQVFLLVIAIEMVLGKDIQSKVNEYFQSESTRNFKKIWDKFQISFENAITMALQSGYGNKGLNVYINRFDNSLELTKGYYHNDNQIKLLLHGLSLTELPNVYNADVTFPLASNMIVVEASVSKLVVDAWYIVFRNTSDIIYLTADQNLQSSPFRYQQVAPMGKIAVSLEGCNLKGYAVVTLSGNSVNVGHPSFKLEDCQYVNEIYEDEGQSPPVIANYLFDGPGINLNTLLLRPLLEELMPKLQAALFSYVNTSAIFEQHLPKIRETQENIFKAAKKFEDVLTRCMNKETLENKNMGTIKMRDFNLTAQDGIKDDKMNMFSLSDVLLIGLDTMYPTHSGGPVQSKTLKYSEQVRFRTLQVTGSIGPVIYKEDKQKFAAEITDLAVNIEVDSAYKLKYDVLGWRNLEFSSSFNKGGPVEAFVVGYLQYELPKLIKEHLDSVYRSCENVDS